MAKGLYRLYLGSLFVKETSCEIEVSSWISQGSKMFRDDNGQIVVANYTVYKIN